MIKKSAFFENSLIIARMVKVALERERERERARENVCIYSHIMCTYVCVCVCVQLDGINKPALSTPNLTIGCAVCTPHSCT